ncbi:MAG: multicopper oxidase domain-containing protein [Verrucomicrobiales bacterium]
MKRREMLPVTLAGASAALVNIPNDSRSQIVGNGAAADGEVENCNTPVFQATASDFIGDASASRGLLFRQRPLEPVPSGEFGPDTWDGKRFPRLGQGPAGIAKEFGPQDLPAGGDGVTLEYLDDDDTDAESAKKLRGLMDEAAKARKEGKIDYYEMVIGMNSAQIMPTGKKTDFLGYGQLDAEAKKSLVPPSGTELPAWPSIASVTTPGPMIQSRIGRPVVMRFVNATDDYMSVHLHGGHSPAHSDGHPAFMIPKRKESGLGNWAPSDAKHYWSNHRDYYYPNTVPAHDPGRKELDYNESPSTMWYHDHSMDITGPHVAMGLAGFFPTFDDLELDLLRRNVLPSLHPNNKRPTNADETYEQQKRNPFDLAIVLQDRCFGSAADGELENQFLYSAKGHNGFMGHRILVNGILHPRNYVVPRKYRLRVLNGSNARIYKLALHYRIENERGEPTRGTEETLRPLWQIMDAKNPEWFRIAMDSWLYPEPVAQRKVLLAMAKRTEMIIDFAGIEGAVEKKDGDLKPGERVAVYLVNLLHQVSGRGPKLKLDDANEQAPVLPFQAVNADGAGSKGELDEPWPLLKFVIERDLSKHPKRPKETGEETEKSDFEALGYGMFADLPEDASVTFGTKLRPNTPILPSEIVRTREVVFERGNGIWQINGQVIDEFLSNFVPELNSAECWILENGGGGWWHPIHIHLESHQQIDYLEELELPEYEMLIGSVLATYEQAVVDERTLGNTDAAEELGSAVSSLRETLAPVLRLDPRNIPPRELARFADDEISIQRLARASVQRIDEFARARELRDTSKNDQQKEAYLRLKKAYEGLDELVRELNAEVVIDDHRLWTRAVVPPWDRFKSDTSVLGPNTRVRIFMKFRTFDGPFVFHCHNLEHEDMRMMFVMDPRLTPKNIRDKVEGLPESARRAIVDEYHETAQVTLYRHPWRFTDLPAHDKWAHADSGPTAASPDKAEKKPAWNVKPPESKPRAHPIWGGWDQHI